MRVTQLMMMRKSLDNLTRRTSNIARLQDIISTGKEVEKPSDDSVRFSRAERLTRMLDRNERFQDNVDRAKGWVDSTDLALQQLTDIALDATQVALRAADGTYENEQIEAFRLQVTGMINDALSIANQDFVGKPIFAGSEFEPVIPFSIDSGTLVYTGNDEGMRREFSENLFATINITGQQLADSQLFEELIALETALTDGDEAAISAAIDSLKAVQDNLSGLTAQVGTMRNTLTIAEDRLLATEANLTEFISEEEDADMVESIVKYESEQTVYQAALRVTSEVSQMNILQYL